MNPETISILADAAVNIVGLHELVRYSLGRKFKTDNPARRTMRMWIDRWRIELIFAAVLVPQWADWFPKIASLIIPGAD